MAKKRIPKKTSGSKRPTTKPSVKTSGNKVSPRKNVAGKTAKEGKSIKGTGPR